MPVFLWILVSGLLMSAIALVGAVTLVLKESTLQRLLLPLVALSAGSLIGGAFFHMIPAAFNAFDDLVLVGLLVARF
jgi:zinc and cadmium transporter